MRRPGIVTSQVAVSQRFILRVGCPPVTTRRRLRAVATCEIGNALTTRTPSTAQTETLEQTPSEFGEQRGPIDLREAPARQGRVPHRKEPSRRTNRKTTE